MRKKREQIGLDLIVKSLVSGENSNTRCDTLRGRCRAGAHCSTRCDPSGVRTLYWRGSDPGGVTACSIRSPPEVRPRRVSQPVFLVHVKSKPLHGPIAAYPHGTRLSVQFEYFPRTPVIANWY